jgi:hypothetical protein
MSVIALVAAVTKAHQEGLEVSMIHSYANYVYVSISTKRNQDGSYDRVFADRYDENDVEGMTSLIEHATKQIVEFPL